MRSVFILLIVEFAWSTRVKFQNHCGHQIHVMRQETGHAMDEQSMLDPGESEMSENFENESVQFGEEDGMDMAEIKFNGWNGMDLYDIDAKRGFSTPIMIETDRVGGRTVSCRHRNCLGAYHNQYEAMKTHGVQKGGMFTVTFCP